MLIARGTDVSRSSAAASALCSPSVRSARRLSRSGYTIYNCVNHSLTDLARDTQLLDISVEVRRRLVSARLTGERSDCFSSVRYFHAFARFQFFGNARKLVLELPRG